MKRKKSVSNKHSEQIEESIFASWRKSNHKTKITLIKFMVNQKIFVKMGQRRRTSIELALLYLQRLDAEHISVRYCRISVTAVDARSASCRKLAI